ncbi:helix-turn-helix domain-containing protein [Rheinheimera marina]|uniref:Helix-turn-helix domain-containing protein n=1 Tax=Rheinheimera marina TaxID=1774958 RepID=A0ABV9JLE6_9GAMM
MLLCPHEPSLLFSTVAKDMLQCCVRRGFHLQKLLKGTPLFPADLDQPRLKLSVQHYLQLVENCQKLWPGPELAHLTAQAWLHNNQHPLLQLLQHCQTMPQALLYFVRYQSLLLPLWYPRLQRKQGQIRLELRPALQLGAARPFIEHLLCSFFAGLFQRELGRPPEKISLTWLSDNPDWSYPLEWGLQPQLAANWTLSWPQYWQQQPLRQACANRKKLQLSWCQMLQQSLPPRQGLWQQTEQLLFAQLPDLPAQEQAAQQLGIALSRYKRLLAQQNCSYQQLCDQVRFSVACDAMAQDLPNRQLALLLGYSDEHNFRRAFKRWAGLLPSQLRALL